MHYPKEILLMYTCLFFFFFFFREAKVQRAVTLCAADEDTQHEKKSVKNVANVNFTGVALYSAMYAKKKS